MSDKPFWVSVWVCGAIFQLCLAAPALQATEPRSALAKGSSSRRAREEVQRIVPWSAIQPQVARQIHEIIEHPTIYRRLPSCSIECDRDLHLYLVRNPEVIVHIWQRLGITNLSVKRAGKYLFDTDDGMGTTARVDLVYGSPELHIFLAKGQYSGPLLPQPIRGQAVSVLRSQWFQTPAGKVVVRDDLDVFVRLDSGPIDLAARTLQPLFIRNADYNFVETANFVERVHLAARESPDGMQRLISQLTNLHPTVRQGFVEVTQRIADEALRTPDGYPKWEAHPVQYRTSLPDATPTHAVPATLGTRQTVSRYPVDGPLVR